MCAMMVSKIHVICAMKIGSVTCPPLWDRHIAHGCSGSTHCAIWINWDYLLREPSHGAKLCACTRTEPNVICGGQSIEQKDATPEHTLYRPRLGCAPEQERSSFKPSV